VNIKEKINCYEYATKYLGIPCRSQSCRVKSPLQENGKNPALQINPEFFYDFSINKGGDVIDMCATYKHDGDISKAFRELNALLGIKYSNKPQKHHTQAIETYSDAITPEAYQYLLKRGITRQTIKEQGVGFNDGRIIVPAWHNGRVYNYIRCSMVAGSDRKYMNSKGDETRPLGLNTFDRERPCIIVEGVMDSLSAIQCGYTTLGLLGGSLKPRYIAYLKNHKHGVILCLDNDDAGRSFALKIAKTLLSNGIRFSVATPTTGKDLNDVLQAHGNITDTIDGAISDSQYIMKTSKTIVELKDWVIKIRDKELAENVLLLASETYPATAIKDIRRIVMTPPRQGAVADKIIASSNLLYKHGMGFYIYSRGVWKHKEVESIEAIIDTELGYHSTAGTVRSVLHLVKTRVATELEFNQGNIFNFTNGTLELDSGEFREHRDNDMTTIKADYSYDADNTDTGMWSDFIQKITNCNTDKQILIQQMFGYCLFEDNSLNKSFFLISEGSNGKSVLLDMLINILGRQSTSQVPLIHLNDKFKRFNLMHSMANIVDDDNLDVRKSTTDIKAITAGNRISGERKGKDSVSFNPRCKLIVSANELLKTNDLTHGFERRLCLISFNQVFATNPKGNEIKADVDINKKLAKEISAIFNWVYEGYKELKKNRRFIILSEQKNTLENIREDNNPVITFEKTLTDAPDMSVGEMYSKYKEWYRENVGSRKDPETQRKFSRDFKKIGSWISYHKSGGDWYKNIHTNVNI